MQSLKLTLFSTGLIFLTLITSSVFNWKFVEGNKLGSIGIIGSSDGPTAIFLSVNINSYVELGLALIGLFILGISTRKVISQLKGLELFLILGVMYVLPVLYLFLKIG